MKCNDREKLFQFVHQMLCPDEAEAVRRHLAVCADCTRKADEYHRLDAALDDWSAAGPSPWFDARARARIAASGQKNSRFFGFGRFRALALGVAALALIMVAVVVFNHQRVAEFNQPPSSLARPMAVIPGQRLPATTEAARRPLPAEEQLKMDENLRVLEDYEVVANFDALSELPQANEN
ncbi:MAG: zf-HC2 domain-containing protein [Acidobacteria bacterium]|nr:MAG: zf-HC2 domain-containing protein [Acidobacteriota bacterium]